MKQRKWITLSNFMMIPIFLLGVVNPMGSFVPGPKNEFVAILYAVILAVSLAVVLTVNIGLLSLAQRIDDLEKHESDIEKERRMLQHQKIEVYQREHDADILRIQYDRLVTEAKQSILIYKQLIDNEKSRMEQTKKYPDQASETATGGT